jgi:transcription antitermination factor NusG
MSFWAAAQIRASQAKLVIWRIERQGFTVYAPQCRATRRSTKITNLFPGYLFISIVDRWRCLLTVDGLINVIRAGDAPARVRPDEIERIRQAENKDGVITLPVLRFREGEKVRVTRGPLRDQVGIVHAGMTPKQRVAVMFLMFEREVQIEMAERDLTAV